MKTLQGTVTSVKTPQTAQVSVVRQWQHPIYGKSVKRTKRYACHVVGDMQLVVGDEVVIAACPPVSKTKRFKVVEKIEVAKKA